MDLEAGTPVDSTSLSASTWSLAWRCLLALWGRPLAMPLLYSETATGMAEAVRGWQA